MTFGGDFQEGVKGKDIRENFQKGAKGTFGKTSEKKGKALRGNFQKGDFWSRIIRRDGEEVQGRNDSGAIIVVAHTLLYIDVEQRRWQKRRNGNGRSRARHGRAPACITLR